MTFRFRLLEASHQRLRLSISSALVAAALFSSGAFAKSTLVFASYGGEYQAAQEKAFVEGFEALHPDISVVLDSPSIQ